MHQAAKEISPTATAKRRPDRVFAVAGPEVVPLSAPALQRRTCACGGGCPRCRTAVAGLGAVPLHLSRAPVRVQRQRAGAQTAPTDPLSDILPRGVGLLGDIDRRLLLTDIFGDQLDSIAGEIRANPSAAALTRKRGILALLALVDTRSAGGLDPAKAGAALDADEKNPPERRVYRRALLEPRAAAASTYWFQPKPPQKKDEESDIPISASRLSEVVEDPENPHTVLSDPRITVNFAFMRSDLRAGKASDVVRRGRTLILRAIAAAAGDLTGLPPAPSKAARLEDERVRARLKEALRGFTAKRPLRVFIASSEVEALIGRSLKTQAVFVRPEDIGDESKLEAAVRIPLVAFLGSPPPAETAALTGAEASGAMLHEALHVMLFRRDAGAGATWDAIKDKAVSGPPTVKNRCEEAVHLSLVAQEEVFVYDSVAKLGDGYAALATGRQPAYEMFVAAVDVFLKAKGAKIDQTTRKLDVVERVSNKKVNWDITFRFPQTITVGGEDLTPLNELISFYPR